MTSRKLNALSSEQRRRLVETIEQQQSKYVGPNGSYLGVFRPDWSLIVPEMNKLDGSQKSESEWRVCWRNLKNKTKTKADVQCLVLSDVEKKILKVINFESTNRFKFMEMNLDESEFHDHNYTSASMEDSSSAEPADPICSSSQNVKPKSPYTFVNTNSLGDNKISDNIKAFAAKPSNVTRNHIQKNATANAPNETTRADIIIDLLRQMLAEQKKTNRLLEEQRDAKK